MWDEEDGFFYDVLHMPDGGHMPLKVRSMVGLIPLFAVETLEPATARSLPGFKRRMEWFIENRPDLASNVASHEVPGRGERRLLAIVDARSVAERLQLHARRERVLLAVRHSRVSRVHKDHPTFCAADGDEYRSTTSRRSRPPASSAAIRTGADRFGFP